MKKSLFLLVLVLGLYKSQAQTSIFENSDFILSIAITSHSYKDSMDIQLDFNNKSTESIYLSKQLPITHIWSVSGKLLFLDFGMDIKKFTESEFSLIQVKSHEAYTYRLTVERPSESSQVKLNVSLGRSKQVLAEDHLKNYYLNKENLNWIGGAYYIPICK